MNKTTSIIGALVIAAGAVVVSIQESPEVTTTAKVTLKGYRQALLDETCTASAEACDHRYKVNGSMCMCCTGKAEKLSKEIEDHETIPPEKAFKYLVCKKVGLPEEGEPVQMAGFYPFTDPPPSGYACTPIVLRGAKEKSVRGIKSRLSEALVDDCCASCEPDECFVVPGKWGMCPYCLLDDSCATHCLAGS